MSEAGCADRDSNSGYVDVISKGDPTIRQPSRLLSRVQLDISVEVCNKHRARGACIRHGGSEKRFCRKAVNMPCRIAQFLFWRSASRSPDYDITRHSWSGHLGLFFCDFLEDTPVLFSPPFDFPILSPAELSIGYPSTRLEVSQTFLFSSSALVVDN